jgi:hypothetical protein
MLHRQVAQHLEVQGLQGAVVLRHWLAADEPDHALPHAAHQLYAASAMGRQTGPLEADLVVLLERTSDPVLLDNLWLTAEVEGSVESHAPSLQTWRRLAALVDRVGRLPRGAQHVDDWLAYERARTAIFLEHRHAPAYATLCDAVARMPAHGVARARCELLLMLPSRILNDRFAEHVRCAIEAVAVLPRQAAHTRLLSYVEAYRSMVVPPVETIRRERLAERQARRRSDMGSALACRRRTAQALHAAGRTGSAARIFGATEWQTRGPGAAAQERVDPMNEGLIALNAGWFDVAMECFDQLQATGDAPLGILLLAMTTHRLGQPARARSLMQQVDVAQIGHYPAFVRLHAFLRAEIDAAEGRDVLPPLEQALHDMQAAGMGGLTLQLMAWEITRRVGRLALRRDEGLALLAAMRATGAETGRLPPVLLDVGEVLVDAGDAQGLALVREGSLAFRRGRNTFPLYIPEALLRCARVLQATDSAEAAAVRHVARRWVLAALHHVPEAARQGFVQGVAANRELLGMPDDGPATEPPPAEAPKGQGQH